MAMAATEHQRALPRGGRSRILAVASGGGHWVQLLRLRPALAEHEVTYVSVDKRYRGDISPAQFRAVNDATRKDWIALGFLAIRLLWILVRVRPDAIVTTGAAPGYFAVRLGKLLGARTIWIDSIANVEQLSLSGRHVGPYADLWLTQWSHLAGVGGPHFAGAVL